MFLLASLGATAETTSTKSRWCAIIFNEQQQQQFVNPTRKRASDVPTDIVIIQCIRTAQQCRRCCCSWHTRLVVRVASDQFPPNSFDQAIKLSFIFSTGKIVSVQMTTQVTIKPLMDNRYMEGILAVCPAHMIQIHNKQSFSKITTKKSKQNP